MTDIPTLVTNTTRTSAVLPPVIMELGTIFNETGEELALAGEPMRDVFLGVTPHDLDMTAPACLERTEELPTQWGNAAWDIGKEFDTIGGRRGDLVVEVTAYRTDEYEVGLRKPEVTLGDTLENDLTCRDFTANVMAMRLPQMVFADPCGGLVDLAGSDLRTPVPAEQFFDDDPLRIMHTARFSAQPGSDADMDVTNAMKIMASCLEIVSAEHIRVELERLIISPHPRRGIELMVHTGVADIVLPEVAGLVSTVDEHKCHKDVYERTLTVVEQVMDLKTGPDDVVPAPDFILRFTAPMRDVGKPVARRFEPNGTVPSHCYGIVGVKMTRKCMKALHFDKATIEVVSNLVALHLRFHGYGEAAWSDSAVRRCVASAGDLLERPHHLAHADCTTRNRRKANYLSTAYDDLKTHIAALREQEELDAVRLNLGDDQIMRILRLRPSRAVKIARGYLLELRMEHGLLGEEAVRRAFLDWWAPDDVHALIEEYQAQQAHWEAKIAEKEACKATARVAREARGQ